MKSIWPEINHSWIPKYFFEQNYSRIQYCIYLFLSNIIPLSGKYLLKISSLFSENYEIISYVLIYAKHRNLST